MLACRLQSRRAILRLATLAQDIGSSLPLRLILRLAREC